MPKQGWRDFYMSKVKDYAEEIYGEEYPDITKDNNYGL